MLEGALGLREEYRAASGLDEKTFALVKIATLIALDAPPASFAWQVTNAVEAGVTPEEIVGVLRAVAPQVGGPRVIAAAPEIMLALGLSISDDPED
jgi:4-carboxymuconolactone decarboxylase